MDIAVPKVSIGKDDKVELTINEIIDQLSAAQRLALLTDERAVEELQFQDRDAIITLGLARRAWPQYTGDSAWRTWLTPLGLAVRIRLAPLHYSLPEVKCPGCLADVRAGDNADMLPDPARKDTPKRLWHLHCHQKSYYQVIGGWKD